MNLRDAQADRHCALLNITWVLALDQPDDCQLSTRTTEGGGRQVRVFSHRVHDSGKGRRWVTLLEVNCMWHACNVICVRQIYSHCIHCLRKIVYEIRVLKELFTGLTYWASERMVDN